MTDLVASLMVLVACVGIFHFGTLLGERRCLKVSLLGYLVPVLFTLTALTVAVAQGGDELITSEIWQAADGTYTDMPKRYSGDAKPWKPSRDRWTPVVHTSKPALRDWSVMAAVRVVPHTQFCAGVFLGNTLLQGGAAVCRGERAVIKRERVKRRGSITTTTDTVLTVGGLELMRIEGPRYDHNPTRTVRRE